MIMPAPNEPTPPKKPTNPSGKPLMGKLEGKGPPPKIDSKTDGKAPAPKPEAKPQAKPDGKLPAPKAEGKPEGKPASKPEGKGAAPKRVVKGGTGSGGRRKIGQVLIDLGFLTEDQLWEILEESKGGGSTVGQTALNRGLIDENQLFQALAEQHGMKIADMEDVKPTPEAIQLVPETMATVYKCLPLTVKDKILTVVMSDPSNPAALDDLRNFLGVKEVKAMCAPPKIVEESIAKFYAGKEESILDLIQQIEADPDLGARLSSRKETSIDLDLGGNMVDMRVSVLPTMFGESVVIRVLDRTVVQLDLNKVGMETQALATFRNIIRRPNGIILVTGPTGSGKTTTLYSALNELNEITDKIITTEDPVEYDIDGIIQLPINPDIDVTFANCLRSILRQD